MARRRFISLDVIEREEYLFMPPTSRLLYTDLIVRADDDGFVISPHATMRMTGATNDDLLMLIAKGFVYQFASGYAVIRHWGQQNKVQPSKKTATKAVDESSVLFIDNDIYYPKPDVDMEMLSTETQPVVSATLNKPLYLKALERADLAIDSQRIALEQRSQEYPESVWTNAGQRSGQGRIGQDSLGKVSLGQDSLGQYRGGEDKSAPTPELKDSIRSIVLESGINLPDAGIDVLNQKLEELYMYVGYEVLLMFDTCLKYAVKNRKQNPIQYALVKLRKNIEEGYTTDQALRDKEDVLNAVPDVPDIPELADVDMESLQVAAALEQLHGE
ncbi:hypothetical protein [Weissella tructae]